MSRRERRTFTEEFKLQMVQLYNNGKAPSEIVKEYDLTRSALMNWIQKYNKTGSFKESDNISEEEKELKKLKKEVQQLKMENDILKQAALIMGRK
jgi:transposase